MALVAGKRAVRYAAADEEHGNSPASSLAKEIRPDLGFENDDDRRPDGAERSANAKSPVKLKVEYSVREGHPLSGQRLPGHGCRRADECPATRNRSGRDRKSLISLAARCGALQSGKCGTVARGRSQLGATAAQGIVG